MTPIYRVGYWCDVFVWTDGIFGQVTTDGPMLRVVIGDQLASVSTAPEPLLFCRCALTTLGIASIHQGQSGRAWLMVAGTAPQDFGPTYGVQPVAIDKTHAYVVRSGQSYDRIRLSDGHTESFAHPVPGSSQGISDIAPDGTIWWADTHRTMTVAGVTLTYPNRRGAVIVGQSDPAQIVGVNLASPFTAFVGDGFEPHVAQSGDRWAVCARTPRGAAYLEGPPFPPYVAAPSPVPMPPQPQPTPQPENPTMPVPNHLAVVQRVRANYPTPLGATHASFLIEVAKATGGKLLRKDAGTNVRLPNGVHVSQDILGFLNGAECYDILGDGEGAAIPAWSEKGAIAGEYIDPYSVSGSPQPQPGPGPVPPQPTPQPVPQPAPRPSGPSLSQWMDVEFPQLVAAYTTAQGHAPDASWGAFQGYRRFMEPDQWPFEKMLAHERGGS